MLVGNNIIVVRNKEELLRDIKERCVDKEGLLEDIEYTENNLRELWKDYAINKDAINQIFLFECTYIIQKDCLALYYP